MPFSLHRVDITETKIGIFSVDGISNCANRLVDITQKLRWCLSRVECKMHKNLLTCEVEHAMIDGHRQSGAITCFDVHATYTF